MKILLSAAVFLLISGGAALASNALTASQIWNNPSCRGSKCELKSASFFVSHTSDKEGAATMVVGGFLADSPAQVKNYAYVQYIRGCVFQSDALGQKKMLNRVHFDHQQKLFDTKTWALDIDGRDPVYWSDPNAGEDPLRGIDIPRNSQYVMDNPLLKKDPRVWGGDASSLVRAEIFMMDQPTGGSLNTDGSAINSSLEFKTCLFAIRNLPASVDSEFYPIEKLGSPLHCFMWESKYVFNWKSKRFESSAKIDDFCGVEN